MMIEKKAFINKVNKMVDQFFQKTFSVKPTNIRVIIEEEMLVIKLDGIFSPSEKALIMTREGNALINKVYKNLFEKTTSELKEMLQHIVNEKIRHLTIEINTMDMECFCFVTFMGNIAEKFEHN